MNIGPWIPVSISILKKPEVLAIAKEARVSVAETVGLLVGLWGWAAEHSEDGRLSVSIEDLPTIIGGSHSFWRAVEQMGWLEASKDSLAIPNADRWINGCAKARAAKNRRQARWRENRRAHKVDEMPVGAYTRLPNGDRRDAEAPTEAPTTEALVGAYNRLHVGASVGACRRLQPSTRRRLHEAPVDASPRLPESPNLQETSEISPTLPTEPPENVDACRCLQASTREEEIREKHPPYPPEAGGAVVLKQALDQRRAAAQRLVEAFYAARPPAPASIAADVELVLPHLEQHAEMDIARALDLTVEYLAEHWPECRTLRAARTTFEAALDRVAKAKRQRSIGFHNALAARQQLAEAEDRAQHAEQVRALMRPAWDAMSADEKQAVIRSIPGHARLPEKLLIDACLDRLASQRPVA